MVFFSRKCLAITRLDGKTAIVTGSNTGIGRETVKELFLRGARVIMACRNIDKANQTAEAIRSECSMLLNSEREQFGEIIVKSLDLSSLKSIKICAEDILINEQRIDLLINNAGIFLCPLERTEDGFEMQFGTNHLGHFYLTLLLLPKICQSAQARIINVSSTLHAWGHLDFDDLNWTQRDYSAFGSYNQSKLANVLFTQELAKRIQDAGVNGVTVYTVNPGFVKTEAGRYLNSTYFRGLYCIWRMVALVGQTPLGGAQTTLHCALDGTCGNQTGLYYNNCQVATPGRNARNNHEDAERLWVESSKLVGLSTDYNPFVIE